MNQVSKEHGDKAGTVGTNGHSCKYGETGGSLEKALALAALGLHVFPVGRNKKPVLRANVPGEGGFYMATTDPERIRAMWTDSGRWAEHVGVWGKPSGFGALDLDVDPAKGKNGLATVEDMGLPYVSPLTYPSGNGIGEHHIFRTPEDVRGQNGIVLDVDWKSGLSYWIWYGAVPSRDALDAVPDAPDWLLRSRSKVSHGTVTPADSETVRAFLDALSGGELSPQLAACIEVKPRHYEDLKYSVRMLVTYHRLGGYSGLQTAASQILESYKRSPVTSIPEEDRTRKFVDLVAWHLAALY